MNLFILIDEQTDGSTKTVQAQAEIVMDALRNSSNQRPRNEWIGGKVIQQLVS